MSSSPLHPNSTTLLSHDASRCSIQTCQAAAGTMEIRLDTSTRMSVHIGGGAKARLGDMYHVDESTPKESKEQDAKRNSRTR